VTFRINCQLPLLSSLQSSKSSQTTWSLCLLIVHVFPISYFTQLYCSDQSWLDWQTAQVSPHHSSSSPLGSFIWLHSRDHQSRRFQSSADKKGTSTNRRLLFICESKIENRGRQYNLQDCHCCSIHNSRFREEIKESWIPPWKNLIGLSFS